MQSDLAAFFSAMDRDPLNDLPKLIFADWLEEQAQWLPARRLRRYLNDLHPLWAAGIASSNLRVANPPFAQIRRGVLGRNDELWRLAGISLLKSLSRLETIGWEDILWMPDQSSTAFQHTLAQSWTHIELFSCGVPVDLQRTWNLLERQRSGFAPAGGSAFAAANQALELVAASQVVAGTPKWHFESSPTLAVALCQHLFQAVHRPSGPTWERLWGMVAWLWEELERTDLDW